MGLKALTLADNVKYVSDLDPSKKKVEVPIDADDLTKGTKTEEQIEDGATTFHLKPLDLFLMAHIYDNSSTVVSTSDGAAMKTRVNQTNIDAVRHGLTRVDNFFDGKSNPVRVDTIKTYINGREYEVADDKTLAFLGLALINELGGKIKEISELSADEAKN